MEIALTTVILIVLSMAVLTILFVYFSERAGIFIREVEEYTPKSNLDSFVGACNLLVSRKAEYSYCCEKKEVVLSENNSVVLSCGDAALKDWGRGRIKELECSQVKCK